MSGFVPGQSFVGANGNGFDVYVNGQFKGNYSSQSQAEQAFNDAAGNSNSGGSGGSGGISDQHRQALRVAGYPNWNDPNLTESDYANISAGAQAGAGGDTGGGGGGGSMQKLLDAIASGDKEKFDEAVREYNATLANQQAEFKTNTSMKNREDYSSLAQNLLSTAASLRGPKDYFQYQQMLSNGKDLFTQLYGNQPRPAFSAPTGQITPVGITDLMNQMGFTAAPPVMDTGAKITGAPGSHILAILQAGEKVIPAPRASNGNSRRDGGPVGRTREGIPVFDTGGIVPSSTTPIIPGVGGTNIQDVAKLLGIPLYDSGGVVPPANTQSPDTSTGGTPANPLGPPQAPPPINSASGPAAPGAVPSDTGGASPAVPPPGPPPPPHFTSPTTVTPAASPPAAPPPTPLPQSATQPPPPATTYSYPTGETGDPNGGAAGQYNTANGWLTVQQMLDQLNSAAGGQWGGDHSEAGIAAAFAGVTGKPVTAYGQGTANKPPPPVPAPYQINPAVWDALGPTGQALALSAAEAAGWDKNDYLAQINAQRPVGTAPAYSIMNYYTPGSVRSSTEGMFGVY